ncbi:MULTISPECIES: ParB N-terminal domain-containing protein [Nocardia]|uniref:ParB N-terminal domain-containing protein n=1 Tax=Nocardia TaxID=1817 RepID=UPI00265B231C|nr:ParB N-terminal domain-containing protein [Nocardia sp. PE-7]WKG08810.1 ParB N-terminal domain-containing protein [Nocardia sp. PE-7]
MPATLAEPGTHELTETEQIEPNPRDAEDNPDADATTSPNAALEVVPPLNAEAGFRDPRELVIGENIRQEFDPAEHPKQAASIQAFGVQAPVLVERETDGSLHVLDGQVRTLIAITEGVGTVPVWITDVDTSIEINERRITRALRQLNLNDRRIPITDADRAGGVALMLDLGASVTRIAEGLQTEHAKIRTAGVIGRSATARGLLDDSQYSLAQLETIAHYEALGDTDAVAQLSFPRINFRYRATLIEQDRAMTHARLAAALPYAEIGFGVLTEDPDLATEPTNLIPATDLVTGEGETVTETEIYADAYRWAVYVVVDDSDADLIAEDTGELVDPDTVDWDATEPGIEPGEGLRSAHGLVTRQRWVPAYYLLAEHLPASGLQVPVPEPVVDRADDPVDATETEQADRETARAARRRVIELNKQGSAAKIRRIEFLTELLTARTAPPGTAMFVATSLNREPGLLSSWGASTTTHKLLGVTSTGELTEKIAAAATGRAWVIVLALVLGALESQIDKDSWRRPPSGAGRYLNFLADLGARKGFALVDVERAITGEIDYNDIDLDNPAAAPVGDEMVEALAA